MPSDCGVCRWSGWVNGAGLQCLGVHVPGSIAVEFPDIRQDDDLRCPYFEREPGADDDAEAGRE